MHSVTVITKQLVHGGETGQMLCYPADTELWDPALRITEGDKDGTKKGLLCTYIHVNAQTLVFVCRCVFEYGD